MRRNTFGLAILAVAALFGTTLGACASDDAPKKASKSDSAPAASTDTVTVKDFVFGPRTIKVKAGDTVTWSNRDDFDHSVQIDSLMLDGPKFGPVTQPATFAHRFDTPGTYAYLCGVHNSMTGTVVVTS